MDTHHLRTILWLRWRIMRNQWKKSGPINAVLSIVVAIGVLVIGISGSLAGFWAGFSRLPKDDALALLTTWDVIACAFTFLWMMGILTELQRSESIDISRLLHLPVSVKQIYVINYLVSHLTFSVVLLVPGMVGLGLGLMLGRSWVMSLSLLVMTGLIFAITAWTYCLRGWLVSLMSNPRKRRTAITIVTFTFIVIIQLPNVLGQTLGNRNRRRPQRTVQTDPNHIQTEDQPPALATKTMPRALWIAHQTVPFLWPGHSAMTLAQGHVLPALWRAAVLFGLGALGLNRAYRMTIRFYHGQTRTRRPKAKRRRTKTITSGRTPFLERCIPGLSQESSVLALASFRSMARAPEVKMQLATQNLMLLLFGVMALVRNSSTMPEAATPFLPTGAVLFTFFSLSQLMFNQFGFDRNGFRSYLLWPAPRHRILLGKNLSFLPIALFIGITILAIVTVSKRLPVIFVACGLAQLMTAFLLLSMIANVTSILMPYRISQGSLKPTKTRPLTTFLLVLSSLGFPLLIAPVIGIPVAGYFLNRAGWIPPELSNPLLSAILLGLSALCYKRTLPALGRLLQRREQRILDIVTHEVE
jgi:ABC-2 type transport system permease protein